MIEYRVKDYGVFQSYQILFEVSDKDRIYNALFRGTNTLSPPDESLIKLLEDMKK
jgi:hypothetical protein